MMFLLSKLAIASCWGVSLLLLIYLLHKRCPIEIRPFLWRLTWLKMLFVFLPLGAVALPWLPPQPSSLQPALVQTQNLPSNDLQFDAGRDGETASGVSPSSRAVTQDLKPDHAVPLIDSKRSALDSREPTLQQSHFTANHIFLAVLVLWSLGVIFQLVRLGWSYRQLRTQLLATDGVFSDHELAARLAQKAGLKGAPKILICTTSDPFLCGVFSPTVVISRQICGDKAVLQMTLAHEFSHLKRRDLCCDLLGMSVQILFWFLPIVHIARRAEKSAVEAACDAQTLRRFAFGPQEYGALLVQMAARHQSVQPRPAQPLAFGMSDGFQDLKSRLQLLKGQQTKGSKLLLSVALLGIAASMLIIPLRFVPASTTQTDPIPTKVKKLDLGGPRQIPDASAVFEGNVSDERNSPIAAAKVYVMRTMTSGQEPLFQTVTDDGGNFSINAREAKLDARFSYEIWADAPERGIGFARYQPGKGAKRGEITLDFTSFFRPVFNYKDKWISGVKVRVKRIGTTWTNWYSVPKPILEHLASITDANGEVRFRVPRGAFVQLEHEDSRFAPLIFAATHDEVATLQTPSSVCGYVRFPDGKPGVGIDVSARYVSGTKQQSLLLPLDHNRKSVRTDARGFYRISGLREGKYRLMVRMGEDGRVSQFSNYVTRTAQPTLIAGEENRENFTLQEGVLLTGGVTSKSSGEVIAGQHLRAVDSQGNTHYAISKSSGRFEFRLMPGQGQLFAHGNNVSPPKGFALPVKNVWNFDLEEGYSTSILIQLPDAPGAQSTIKGIVLGADGEPVEGVRVCYYSTDKSKDSRIHYMGPRIKSDGEFLLAGRHIGTSALVWASRGTKIVSTKVEAKLGDKIVLRLEEPKSAT